MELATGLGRVPRVSAALSLSTGAELLHGTAPPTCQLPVRTYQGMAGFAARLLTIPFSHRKLSARLGALGLDAAICAMPGPLDLLMSRALRRARIPSVVVVHDATLHPGDGLPFQMHLQRRLLREADALVVLTEHVARGLREQGAIGAGTDRRPLFMASLPPLVFGPPPLPPGAHGGRLRLLSFGRLLPYKGLDLLAEAMRLLGPSTDFELRVVGSGPESAALAALRALSTVRVENRWVPEEGVGDLLAWADAIVLSHREASQSGVAAAALAARRWVVATRVGGLAEQLASVPTARLCEPDPASLAAAIKSLRQNPPPAEGFDPNPGSAWQDVAARLVSGIERELLGGRAES